MNFYKQYLILCDFELKEVDASQFDRFQSGKSRPHGLVCQFSRYPFFHLWLITWNRVCPTNGNMAKHGVLEDKGKVGIGVHASKNDLP